MKDSGKRARVMRRSMRLGHCICNPKQPCPCEEFKEFDVCHCAGERREIQVGPVRLTALVENPGCASKIDQASLARVLTGLPEINHPDVLVGAPAADDAGVFRINDKQALVQTVDVFCPSVDDPYTFGQIAAANSLSDVYAMGGKPLTALSIVGYPIREAPRETLTQILKGGVDKMAEAGVPVVGGHSINDREIKAGFAVTGIIDVDKLATNAAARPGDFLVLTKPLGTGIIAFAGQIGIAEESWLEESAASMTALNRTASELMVDLGAHAATDVTGFGLAGHLAQMARSSNVDVEVVWDDVPLLPGVLESVSKGALPGGIERNRESSESSVDPADGLTREMLDILFDAQTSGGLLVALAPEDAEAYVRRLREEGVQDAAVVGKVVGKGTGRVRVATSGARKIPEMAKETIIMAESRRPQGGEEPACCAGEPAPVAADDAACCAGKASPCTSSGTPALQVADGEALPSGAAGAEAAFKEFMRRASAPGAVDVATKQALNLALSLVTRCGPCTKTHIKKAREMGFTQEEIDEIACMAIAFGGCSVMMFYNQFKR